MDSAQTLDKIFEVQAEKCPNRVALIFENHSLTYEQLNQKANQLAHYLIQVGVQPDTLVALFLERSSDFLIAVLGILKAGGAYIPLDTSYPDERISLILKEAGNPLLITSSSHKKKFISETAVLNLSDIDNQPTHNPLVSLNTKNLAYVIYTSGSTGIPKGVLIEHAAVINYALWFSQLCDGISTVDFSSNHAFDLSVTLYLVPLVLGLTVVICKDMIKKDPKRYLKYLNHNEIDFIKITPSYFKVLVNEAQNKAVTLPHLKKIMLGGENLAKAECKSWLSLYPHHVLYNEYGPTETTVAVTVFALDKNNIDTVGDSIPIGRLATNTYAYLLDKQLKPVAQGEVGELYLGGLCLARGYLNSPNLTQTYFIPDPLSQQEQARLYKTGDLCRLLAGDNYECLGRIDHQIKIRGFRVELDEIEYYLSLHPALKSVVLIASDHQKEKSLLAYYILKNPNKKLKTKELNHYLKRFLPEYMIPSSFIRMDSFPLNANDKLDRAALPIPQLSRNRYYVPVRKPLEKVLATIWSEELGINPIGLKDDFFELGGHSLSAARILSKINNDLKIDISLQEFYANTTIFDLIPIIKKAKKIEKKQSNLTKKIHNDLSLFPLSDFQFMLWIANTFEPKAKKLNIFARKRVQGHFDLKKLNRAIELLLQKHEVLSYQISRFRPGQYLVKNAPLGIIEESLELLSDEEKEKALQNSARELINYAHWSKNIPQIRIRLFYLKEDSSELQLSIPHILSDDLTPEILLEDLSEFYCIEDQDHSNQLRDSTYRAYLLEEQLYLKDHLNKDIDFWDDYLKDTHLYSFPSQYVIKDMKSHNYSYSTYVEIPEAHLSALSAYCANNHISVLDGLCALVALALKNETHDNKNTSMCINRVKSKRDSEAYDHTVGCFLRIEPIKLDVRENSTLSSLSQHIHQAVINTHPYQDCPNLVKLASISTFRKEKKPIKTALVKTFFWIYSLLFQAQLYYKTLRILARLNSIKGDNFLININMQSTFLMSPDKDNEHLLFGFNEQNIPSYQYDLLEIDNLFDVSFLRIPESKKPYLVISANLRPDFKEAIGKEVIRLMNHDLSIRE